MAPPPAPSAPGAPSPSEDAATAIVERQLALLGRLAEAGLEIALAIERQVKHPENDAAQAALGDPALAYARVARAVRLTIALQSRLLQDQAVARARAARDRAGALEDQAEERKRRAEGIVRRVLEAEADTVETADRLLTEATERLEDDDLMGDVLSRPLSEIVADVCQALGLDPDWWTLAEEAWAREEIAAGAPGAPLAAVALDRTRPPPPAGEGDPEGVEGACRPTSSLHIALSG